MNEDLQNRFKLLASKTVGIAGCGGLGSNCAVALARIGVGRFVLADFDVIDEGNLNRQYFFRDQIGQKKVSALKENILRIMPNIQIQAHDVKLDADSIKDLYSKCDVIVEAFDRADMKAMIVSTVLSVFPEKHIVSGSGLAGWGNTQNLKVRQKGNLFICGDEKQAVCDKRPPLAPRVGIVANMQANVVLELLLD